MLFLTALFTACSGYEETSVLNGDELIAEENLIIVGQGGPSGGLFSLAAQTYQAEDGGVIYEVASGREFIAAIEDFYSRHGKISHLEYFGHGNNVGLYVNQEHGINGGLYANDPDMNEGYQADSIYRLDNDLFSDSGWIRFNGCNVADGYPKERTLAQDFANYFNVTVVAPTGPTEFASADENIYMIATYDKEGFKTIEPQLVSSAGFEDVRVGQSFERAVKGLLEMGLDLDWMDDKFLPYKNISYAEAFEFCKLLAVEENACYIPGYNAETDIRNLQALKMLLDAGGVQIAQTDPWHRSYIDWANGAGILTKDFTNKRWYTRGEMAELAWNLIIGGSAGTRTRDQKLKRLLLYRLSY